MEGFLFSEVWMAGNPSSYCNSPLSCFQVPSSLKLMKEHCSSILVTFSFIECEQSLDLELMDQ